MRIPWAKSKIEQLDLVDERSAGKPHCVDEAAEHEVRVAPAVCIDALAADACLCSCRQYGGGQKPCPLRRESSPRGKAVVLKRPRRHRLKARHAYAHVAENRKRYGLTRLDLA